MSVALHRLSPLNGLLHDVRYSLRAIRKTPGVTAIAVLALSLGIGSVTTIYSVIYNVLLEPFPYKGSDRLVNVIVRDIKQSEDEGRRYVFTNPEFLGFQEQNRVLEGVIGASISDILYDNGEGTEQLRGAALTPNTYSFLGIPALIGRTISEEDGKPGAPPVVLLSYKLWVSRFQKDQATLGRTMILNGKPYTIIGVISTRFGWWAPDVWIPGPVDRSDPDATQTYRFLQGRLKPGISTSQAAADLTVIAKGLAKIFPKQYPEKFTVEVQTVTDFVVGRFRRVLYSLLAAVGLLLLIACGNVANLLLARATAREREIAIRSAVGAGRWQLIRQLLVESALLGFGGVIGGCILAYGGIRALVAWIPQETIPDESVISLNLPVLLFSVAVAAATILVFGLTPAIHASRQDLAEGLRTSGKGVGSGFRHARLSNGLVVTEVALSFVLLVGAGLLMRTFFSMVHQDLGFDPNGILAARIPLPAEKYQNAAQQNQFLLPLMERIAALPGVVAASDVVGLPPYGGPTVEVGVPGITHADKWNASLVFGRDSLFPAIGYRLVRGRTFSHEESTSARKVAVINQSLVKQYFGAQDPLGRQITISAMADWKPHPVANPVFEIVGVVADIRNQGVEKPAMPEVLLPISVAPWSGRWLIVRASGNPKLLEKTIQREIRQLDRNVAMANVQTLPEIMRYETNQPRFSLIVLGVFAGIGLTLVAIGVYGVISYSVSRRTNEIGIRSALGARPADVCRDVLRRGLKLIFFGIAVGVVAALGATRVVAAQLWNVSPHDPSTFIIGAIVIVVAGLAACAFPAFRATRVDPNVALRYE